MKVLGPIQFAPDASIRRSAADTLQTDDSFNVNARMAVTRVATDVAGEYAARADAAYTLTATGFPDYIGTLSSVTINGAVNHTGNMRGAQVRAGTASGFSATQSFSQALYTQLLAQGGTLASGRHIEVGTVVGSGTITTQIGVYINNMGRSGTTNSYGLLMAAQTGSTNTYGLVVGEATTRSLWLSYGTNPTTPSGGITFGSSADTNLYRSAAGVLRTDGNLAAATVSIGTNPAVGSGGGTLRMPNSNSISFRNAANDADARVLTVQADNRVRVGTADISGGLDILCRSDIKFMAVFTQVMQMTASALIFSEGVNIQSGTATGTKIGMGPTEKLAFYGATPIVRPTDWAAATGTATRTTFATTTATVTQLAERLKALIDDLSALGLIGA